MMRTSSRTTQEESTWTTGRGMAGRGWGYSSQRVWWSLVAAALLLASGALAQTTYTTRYTYDADGNRTSITYPSGNVVTHAYDYADRPYSATSGATPLVSSAAYLPFGPETQVAYGNGTTKTMLYDSRYRVQQNKLLGPSGVIAQYDYQEDAAGNITQIHDATDPGFNRDFAYDDLQRLVTANSGASLWGAGSYGYDAMGNMLSTSVTPAKTFSYNGTTPKLLAVATAGVSHSLSYDAAGNETGYIANRTYSSRNQLLSVTDSSPAGHTIAYGYDGRGIRVTRSESPVGTGTARSVFTYSPELNLLGVARDDAANYDIDWFGSTPVAQSGGAGLRYTFTDHLGTPVLQTDPSDAVIWRAEYDPYGDIRQMRIGTSTDQPLRLPGQEVAMNSEGGEENYNIFRWYRAGWGRYTQADPIGVGYKGTNLYAYGEDSPMNVVDPSGLFTISAPPKETKQIAQAMVSINHKLASMNGCCTGPLRDKLMELLSDPDFDITYHPSLSSIRQCGMTPGSIFPGKTTTVWIGSGPFNGKCCNGGSPADALASTILHEMVHAALSKGPGADPAAFATELKCYGCKE